MRTDSNSLLSISTPSTAKKAPLNRIPERNGAAFSDDFSRAQQAFEPKKEAYSRNSKTEESRAKSASHEKETVTDTARVQNKDQQQAASDVATHNAKKEGQQTLASTSPSTSNESKTIAKNTDAANSEEGNGGKNLQVSGEASPKQDSSTNQEMVKQVTAEMAGAGVAAKAAQQTLVDSTQSDILTSAEGALSEVDATQDLKTIAAANEAQLAQQPNVITEQPNVITGQSSQQALDLSAQQEPVVQVMVEGQVREISLTLPLSDEQLEGLSTEQIAALQALALKQVTENPQANKDKVAASTDLLASSTEEESLTKEQKVAAALAANQAVENQPQVKPTAVAAAVTAGLAASADVAEATDDGQLSWVMDQMASTPKKAGSENLVTGMLADQTAKDNAKQVLAAGAGLGLAANKMNTESSAAAATDMLEGVDVEAVDVDMLPNEPIELRKKEHEAMLSRMVGQNPVADDAMTLNSSLNQQQLGRTIGAAGVASQLATPNQAATNLAMSVPPGHPNWAAEMGQKVAWIARDGGHTAHIRLDPPELGSLTVKVSVDNDSNTQINFVAATPQARDLLESQMGRLRDMLAQQGVDLSRAEVDVSQQDASGAQKDPRQSSLIAGNDGGLTEQEEEEVSAAMMSYVSPTGVDYYA